MFNRLSLLGSLLATVLLLVAHVATAESSAKKKVTSQSDLPRFTYPMDRPASELLQADAATFDTFASKVRADLETVFRDYDVADKATMRDLLSTKLNLQQLAGEYPDALATVKQLRELEEKPAARLTSGLATESVLKAAIEKIGRAHV